MDQIGRRAFVKGGIGVAAGAALAGPFQGFVAHAAGTTQAKVPNLGPLGPVPDQRDGIVRLHLPTGFEYRSFHDNQATPKPTLDGGALVPGRHDGMAAFAGPSAGLVALIRNHEINSFAAAPFAPGAPVYDAKAPGGTTTTLVDLMGNVSSAVASLTGTQMNCAGGRMPWGAWVTCEETVNGPDVFDDFTRGALPPTTYVQNKNLTKPHGYIFEVPLSGAASGLPITHAGRFPHEAVAYDPHDGVLYLTEDNFAFPSGLYKYVPPVHPSQAGRIEDGGTLFMLRVERHPNTDLSSTQDPNVVYKAEWVRIDDPNPTFPMITDASGAPLPTTTNDQALVYVASQGWAQGVARFSRLEGAVYDDKVIYFCSTQGAGAPEDPDISTPRATGYGKGSGQIWAYHTRSELLRPVYQSTGGQPQVPPNLPPEVLDFPDNMTTTKKGTIILCEDNTNLNFVRGLTRKGELFDLALNQIMTPSNRTGDEFAGATFSPDYSTLYVNIQASSGMSFAIWGPWHEV
jgi:secreted PhoX family phosphatase